MTPRPLLKNYYRIDEAAAYFDVSRYTIYRFIEAGELPAVRIRNALRIKAADLRRLERQNRKTSPRTG